MKNLILHIGHGKCGSTSLQAFFELNFKKKCFSDSGESFVYAKVMDDGKIHSGLSIKSNPYMTSGSGLNLQNPRLKEILASLEEKFQDVDNLILSSEGWSNHNVVSLEVKKAFESQNYKIKIFMVSRPQIDFLNSGWWQWGLWAYNSVELWVKSHKDNVNFFRRLHQWSVLDNIEQINVCDISQDIYQSFLKCYFIKVDGISIPNDANVGTNIKLLRHIYNRRNFYKRTTHAPGIEFKLNAIFRKL